MEWINFENDGGLWPVRLSICAILLIVLIIQYIWIKHTPDEKEPEEDLNKMPELDEWEES